MATVTGLTAARMIAIEAGSVVSGTINGIGHLIFTKHDGSTIDAGYVLAAVSLTNVSVSSPIADNVIQYNGTNWVNAPDIHLTEATSGTNAFRVRVSGDTQDRLIITANGDISAGSGSAVQDVSIKRTAAAQISTDGDFRLSTVGKTFMVKEGTNAKMGVATLVAGTVVVSTTAVTATSRIFLTCNTSGGAPGFIRISARTAGTSFTILSSSATDTSVIAWLIVEPS